MLFMNEFEIDYPAPVDTEVQQVALWNLQSFKDEVNRVSDGWPYWGPALRAAKRTMEVVQGRRPATREELKQANAQLRRFCTKHGMKAHIED